MLNKTEQFPITTFERAKFVGIMQTRLTENEFQVLSLLYGFCPSGEKFPRNEVAIMMEISHSAVVRTEQAAMRKMRDPEILKAMQSDVIIYPVEITEMTHTVDNPLCGRPGCICLPEERKKAKAAWREYCRRENWDNQNLQTDVMQCIWCLQMFRVCELSDGGYCNKCGQISKEAY